MSNIPPLKRITIYMYTVKHMKITAILDRNLIYCLQNIYLVINNNFIIIIANTVQH